MFSKNDSGFSGIEGLCTSEVVSDRSGNERAVSVAKRSNYLKRGLDHNQSFDRMNESWKAFSFQCNFVFKPCS